MNRMFRIVLVVACLVILSRMTAHAQFPTIDIDNGTVAQGFYEGGHVDWTSTGVQHILITPSFGGASMVMQDPGGAGAWTNISGGLGIGGGATADTLGVSGATTLTRPLSANGSVTVVGGTTTDILLVGGAVDLGRKLNVAGGATISGSTTINDGQTVNGGSNIWSGVGAGNRMVVDGLGVNMSNGTSSIDLATGNTITLRSDNDGSGANARSALTMNPTSAALLVNTNTNTGQAHGLTIGQTQTMLSGGTNSTVLILDDAGATFEDENTGAPVTVTGVAEGVAPFDAVNVSQLGDVQQQVQNQGQMLSAGIASIAALAAIPEPVCGKCYAFGLGFGQFNRESAVAVGIKAGFPRSNISASAGLGYCSSKTTVNAGISLSW